METMKPAKTRRAKPALVKADCLQELDAAQLAVDIAVSAHQEDYAEEATALLAAVERCRDAGCSDAEIEAAKNGRR
jgi:hypothetical protein